MQKASKSTDFRVPLSVCTMFNVLMDAKKQCSKLCVLDTGQEVGPHPDTTVIGLQDERILQGLQGLNPCLGKLRPSKVSVMCYIV